MIRVTRYQFDDIAFDKEGTPVQLIQAKHHTTPASLTDVSTDLWRTLNVWFDAISADISLLNHTDFVIITTASVPDNSDAEAIQNQKYQKAYDRLKAAAEDSTNKTNANYYKKFKQADKNVLMSLVKRVKIISSASDIVNVEKDIILYGIQRAFKYALPFISREENQMAKNDRFEKVYSQGTINITEIWVDKETGVNYVFHVSGYAGGMTPLLNREGKPVITTVVNR